MTPIRLSDRRHTVTEFSLALMCPRSMTRRNMTRAERFIERELEALGSTTGSSVVDRCRASASKKLNA